MKTDHQLEQPRRDDSRRADQASAHLSSADGSLRRIDAVETPTPPPTVTGVKRYLFLSAAGVFFVLGTLGALLPGLPATPFLLLCSYCLLRTSPRLNDMLLRSRLLGPILRDWQEHRGVRTDVKVKAIAVVIATVAVSMLFARHSSTAAVALVVSALIGVVVILKLPSID